MRFLCGSVRFVSAVRMGVALEFSRYSAGMSSNDLCDLGLRIFLAKESGDGKTLFVGQVLVGHLCLDSVLTK